MPAEPCYGIKAQHNGTVYKIWLNMPKVGNKLCSFTNVGATKPWRTLMLMHVNMKHADFVG